MGVEAGVRSPDSSKLLPLLSALRRSVALHIDHLSVFPFRLWLQNVNSEHPIESANGDVKFESGTCAFYPFHSEGVNCPAAVKQWKSAFTNFNGLPPPNKEGETAYLNQSNVSLVAMYNPSPDATADCRLVTCTQSVTQDNEQPKTTAASALICLTTPDALPKDGTTAPFT